MHYYNNIYIFIIDYYSNMETSFKVNYNNIVDNL